MSILNQRGAINVLLIPLVIVAILFVASAGFGVWAFSSRADYKSNSDKKVAAAVTEARADQKSLDDAEFAEEIKKPYDSYIGPAAYGNITVYYPKTWSSYVVEAERGGSTPVAAWLYPNNVPSVTNIDNNFALRVELVTSTYQSVLDQFKGRLDKGSASIQPYTLPKVPSVVGSRVEGQITERKQGTMVIFPLRNMTLKVWTESTDFKGDFDTHILPNLSFIP